MPSCVSPRPLPRRLRKRLAECLSLCLVEVDACWAADRVRVITPENGEPQRLALDALVFEHDQVLVDGTVIGPAAKLVHALLNKPKFVTSTARDPREKNDLSPYLKLLPPGVFAVGRLDRETTGLLLFTNDGDLASAVLRPDHSTTKSYWLWIDEPLADDDPRLSRLESGVEHHGRILTARSARIRARTEYATELELELTEGKKRQIRHMCRALKLRLEHLHRFRIGPLTDSGLGVGRIRALGEPEVEALWVAAGGRSALRDRKVAAFQRDATAARRLGAPLLRLEDWLAAEFER